MAKYSLIEDLKKVDWIAFKCKGSETYPQNLYAALCNNNFEKLGETWTCSWRLAGEFVSEMRGTGTYLDWYCSGLQKKDANLEPGFSGFVEEGTVTTEVSSDILNLGWLIK